VTYLTPIKIGDMTMLQRVDHTDCHGHGTHCAATIGGKRYGVAKKCNLISVNVLNADGCCLHSDIIQALIWLQLEIMLEDGCERSVVNLSLGSTRSKLIDDVVEELIELGVHVVAAACNHNNDAIYYSPAGRESVITVGASTFTDARAWFSNKGSLVDVYAPGVFINSATYWSGEDNKGNSTETEMKSGTSMACAHVSGLVAYLLSVEGVRTPAEMKKRVIELSLKGVLSDIPIGSYNRLANFSATMN